MHVYALTPSDLVTKSSVGGTLRARGYTLELLSSLDTIVPSLKEFIKPIEEARTHVPISPAKDCKEVPCKTSLSYKYISII